MTKEEIKHIEKRMGILFTVLIYTSEKNALLSTTERILINQERGYLFSLLGDEPMNARLVPENLEKKITKIIELIKTTSWTIPVDNEK